MSRRNLISHTEPVSKTNRSVRDTAEGERVRGPLGPWLATTFILQNLAFAIWAKRLKSDKFCCLKKKVSFTCFGSESPSPASLIRIHGKIWFLLVKVHGFWFPWEWTNIKCWDSYRLASVMVQPSKPAQHGTVLQYGGSKFRSCCFAQTKRVGVNLLWHALEISAIQTWTEGIASLWKSPKRLFEIDKILPRL